MQVLIYKTHSNTIIIFHFMVHYPTRDLQRRLGLLKQGVTIFTITLTFDDLLYYTVATLCSALLLPL